jgi:hypothetical protein
MAIAGPADGNGSVSNPAPHSVVFPIGRFILQYPDAFVCLLRPNQMPGGLNWSPDTANTPDDRYLRGPLQRFEYPVASSRDPE